MNIPTLCQTKSHVIDSDDVVYSALEAYGNGESLGSICKRMELPQDRVKQWIGGTNRQHVLRAYEAKYGTLLPHKRGRKRKEPDGR